MLTEKGRVLFHVLVALRQWGEDYFFEPGAGHVRLVDRKLRKPVRRLELKSQDGRVLQATETVVVTRSGDAVGRPARAGHI